MIIVLVGVFLYAGAIFPLTADDEWTDVSDGNISWCMTTIWLGAIGFVLIFAALFSKAWRINKIFSNSSMKRVVIRPLDVIWPMAALGTVMVLVMLIFTLVPECPYTWETSVELNAFGQLISSSGRCEPLEYSTAMDGAVAGVELIALGLCCWQFYKCRNVSVDYSESKWISYAVLSTLQVIAIALPFQFMELTTDSMFLVQLIKFSIICIAVLIFVFAPKIYYWKREKWPPAATPQTESQRIRSAANARVSGRGGVVSGGRGESSKRWRVYVGCTISFDPPTQKSDSILASPPGVRGSTNNTTRSSNENTYGARARIAEYGSRPNIVHLGKSSLSENRDRPVVAVGGGADDDEEDIQIIDNTGNVMFNGD